MGPCLDARMALERLNRNARMVHEADEYSAGLRTDEGDAVEHLPQDGALSRAHARTNTPDEAKSAQSIFEVIAILVGFLSLVALGLLVTWIWNGWLYHTISLDQFLGLRKVLAILVVVYAMLSVGRLIGQATTQGAFPRKFVPELIAFSVFWILVPPIWFLSSTLRYKATGLAVFPG